MTKKRKRNPGWKNEPIRHGLARQGIKTKVQGKNKLNKIADNNIYIDESNPKILGKKRDKAKKILTVEKIDNTWHVYYSASEKIIESFDDKKELKKYFKKNPKYKIDKVINRTEPVSQYRDIINLMKNTNHLKRYEVYSVPAPLKINGKEINVKDKDTAIDLAHRLRKFEDEVIEDEVIIDKRYTDKTPLNKNEIKIAKEKMGAKV